MMKFMSFEENATLVIQYIMQTMRVPFRKAYLDKDCDFI